MKRRPLQQLGHVALSLDEVDALIVVGLFAASSDGKIDDAELRELIADLGALGILDDLSEEEREDEVMRIVGLCDREGLRAMMGTALTLLNGAARETAFALTLRILIADGLLPDAEFEYLRDLRTVLGISDEQFERLVRAAASA